MIGFTDFNTLGDLSTVNSSKKIINIETIMHHFTTKFYRVWWYEENKPVDKEDKLKDLSMKYYEENKSKNPFPNRTISMEACLCLMKKSFEAGYRERDKEK